MKDDVKAVRARIGRKVKQLRLLRRLTQEKLAELVGNQYKHIGQIERGEVNVGIDILTRIAAHLSVDVSELLQPGPADAPALRTYVLTQEELAIYEEASTITQRVKRRGMQRPASD
jgi:transcriptional regulator with XRE-family HTH domain